MNRLSSEAKARINKALKRTNLDQLKPTVYGYNIQLNGTKTKEDLQSYLVKLETARHRPNQKDERIILNSLSD